MKKTHLRDIYRYYNEYLFIPSIVSPNGLLLLYRPKDITNECAFSRHLRFDISFGMGMSDTTTLVFRTLNDIDYECVVEVVASSPQYLLVVVRYPTTIALNCAVNRDALTVLKRWRCVRLCDLLDREVYSPYFVFTVKNRVRFLFKSNSSINSDINANFYQVTITAARRAPKSGCFMRNETICTVDHIDYCFTTGVVCDGIKNCGVDDWFDERKSRCSLPVEKLGYAPVIAVMAALLCLLGAGGHILYRCLPPNAKSFFIFNANEDNRLCIDPVLVPRGVAPDIGPFKRTSIIPAVSSFSSESDAVIENVQANELQNLSEIHEEEVENQLETVLESDEISDIHLSLKMEQPEFSRKSKMKSMSEKLQGKFRSVKKYAITQRTSQQPNRINDV
ncbi:uncharacterized protein LOC123667416 [Melitaea cinxia]|uniref:uncharacterized protein LOC123667416 n=1 Tax=Melitaea cinxia TaxID=113334 RepID=UPI001E271C74|nr:uncharacterized protein LOC123667416 [Melitaea cinxia]